MTPWEESGDVLATLRGALRAPVAFYRSIDHEGPVGRALLFGVLVGTAGSVFTVLWQTLAMLLRLTEPSDRPAETVLAAAAACLAMPLVVTVALVASAAVNHVGLLFVGGARRGYGATLRVNAYAQAPQVLCVAPICGAVAAAVWTIVLTVIGLREAHETTTGRAIAAVVLPIALCACLGAGAAALIVAVLRSGLG